MAGLRLGVAIIAVVAALPACGGGSFAPASVSACFATTPVTLSPSGGTLNFPASPGTAATLTYFADSRIPAGTTLSIGTSTCLSSLPPAVSPPTKTIYAMLLIPSYDIDLVSNVSVQLATPASQPGPYPYAFQLFDGINATTYSEMDTALASGNSVYMPAGTASGLLLTGGHTYVLEVVQDPFPNGPPPPPGP